MKFCKNCGTERKSGQKFCISCGHSYEAAGNGTTEQNPSSDIGRHTAEVSRKPMSKRNKIVILSAVATALILFSAHKFIASLYTPEKTIEAFEQAVKGKNVKEAKKVISFDQFEGKFKDEEINSYLAYLKGYQSEISSTFSFEGVTAGATVMDGSSNEIVKLVKGDKKFGLYQQYKIEALPFEIGVSANIDGVEVVYKDSKQKLNDDLTIRDVLPGETELEGNYKGDYASLEDTEQLNFNDAYANMLDIYFDFEGEYVDVYSNIDDSILFVNGKSTGKKVADIYDFGPIPTDGSISLHAEYETKDGTMKTATQKVINTDYIDLEFTEDTPEETEEALNSFMENYYYASVLAMNAGEFSYVSDYLDPNGKAYTESKDYVKYIYEKGITEEVVSVKVTDYEKTDDGYVVDTNDVYDITSEDGTTTRQKFKSSYKVNKLEDGMLEINELVSTEKQ
ncbi:hypothetical protein M4D71_20810 [Niallia taxi]|uniref:zinc ribbon domain-containing protein n=1 Tax=Niallia taxi TaxID=2499688 RepID=UPI0021A66725|nr:hypothetical protein [Niallia taxi]MCT2346598.1 hypothetical protein [Niallia taxi]